MAAYSRGKIAKQRISPKREAEFMCRSGLDCDALKVELINRRIGYGVFATQNFPKGSFLVEYVGERIVPKEAEEREKKRKIKHTSYMFYFKWNGVKCIDATNTERKGKYIKDEEVGSPLNNCVMRLLVTENYPRLCLFANRDIKAGEELRYDYGEANLPWRQKLLILKQRVKKKLMIPTLHPLWKFHVKVKS
ncbi:N-lysine methyltransferase KMT5A-like isoform X3 [Crassostrea angulata]|uniref:N-lysine methyltransferase KMT5A-like isoform X3 n=1 Tax=Magallana angulata TaxID=2784310 RepID=UPI0022B1AB26|nr:N-lysine methyltransferase KMT5A-like isoform X3 [Crassostrea angulata]